VSDSQVVFLPFTSKDVATIEPTMTAIPTSEPTPKQKARKPKRKDETIQARISHYTPWAGGTNCSQFVNGECISRMASGKRWQDYVDEALACPSEYPFGTRFVVLGKEWTCLDRGGAIKSNKDGTIWLDLLTADAPVAFESVVVVEVPR
jgi:hypothetical protein